MHHPSLAINHSGEELSRQFVSDVVDLENFPVFGDQPVDLMLASPDCKHFSDRHRFTWRGRIALVAAITGYAVLSLVGGTLLTGCGGGDEEPEAVCYVEGEPHPAHACK